MIIYKITNKINDKVYIGQTIQRLETRWRGHCNCGSHCTYIHKAIRKYGKENFTVEQIDVACDRDELDLKEQYWIKFYNSLSPNGYNLTTGGKHNEISDDLRKKMSEIAKKRGVSEKCHQRSVEVRIGKKLSLEHRKRIGEGLKGHVVSEETRRKIGLKSKGRKASPETLKKLSESHKGQGLGRVMSEKTKQILRDQRAGAKNYNARKVVCVETGEVFDTIKEVQIKTGICATGVGNVCRNKPKHKTAGGYHWRYVS